jgi:hypothetical protein
MSGGQRRQVIFPSYLRQGDFHVHDARKRALDFEMSKPVRTGTPRL